MIFCMQKSSYPDDTSTVVKASDSYMVEIDNSFTISERHGVYQSA